MTEKENYLEVLHHGKPQWTPCMFDAYYPVESSLINNKGIPGKGGRDMFGINWLVTEDTGYMATPDPHETFLEDIADWREVIHFPDIDQWDWEGAAKKDLKGYDRKEKMLVMMALEGDFLRLQSMLGVCEGLIALIEDPESVYEFFDAYTDFRCKLNEKLIQYYQPDIMIMGDDICSSDGMMFSRAIYDELIKPFELREGKFLTDRGVVIEHHLCGNAEAIIPDIIETGASIWCTAQPMNDLVEIQKEVGDKLLIHGGWDSFGAHNMTGATEEMVQKEVRRCLDTYFNDGFYTIMPVMIGKEDDPGFQDRCRWASEEIRRYSEQLFKQR